MKLAMLVTLLILATVATAALSAWCFVSGREVLGAINAAMVAVNLISLSRLH